VQVLYQMDLVGVAPRVALGEFATHRVGQDLDGDLYVEPDMALLNGIVEGVAERQGDIDAMVSASLQGHALERLEMLLRAILRAGTYEILAHADVHPRIAINDYMNVAHGFFGGREPAMVNGVLDRIAQPPAGGDGARRGRSRPGRRWRRLIRRRPLPSGSSGGSPASCGRSRPASPAPST
jgi:N utilization substance protein B